MKKHGILVMFLSSIILLNSCELLDDSLADKDLIIQEPITTNTTWKADKVYVVKGEVNIDNAVLTIEPGATIRFESGASLEVGWAGAAAIIANGTAEKPIVFTSIASNPVSGSWNGIVIYSHFTQNSSFTNCEFSYGGTNDKGILHIAGAHIVFNNNTLHHSKTVGISFYDDESYFESMTNNTFHDCGTHAIKMSAAKIHTIGTGNTFTMGSGYGIYVYSDAVAGTITWKNLNVPYYFNGETDIDNATLTIEPGTIFKFDINGGLYFGWAGSTTLFANGTSTMPIVFTSNASAPTAGAWKGLYFYEHNLQNTSMTYCDINYAGKTNEQAIELSYTKLTFSNNIVHNSAGLGIKAYGESSFVAMQSNTISNCATHAIEISAESIHTLGTGNAITCNTGYGILVTGGNLEIASATWKKHTVPYIINAEVGIHSNLTIEAGTILQFATNGSMYFGWSTNAQLNAIGTANSPIIFTSSVSSPAAGAWKGIEFYTNTSTNTVLDYCKFLYAGKGTDNTRAAVTLNYVNGITIKNCEFKDSNGYAIYRYNSSLSANSTGNTFTNCVLGQIGSN